MLAAAGGLLFGLFAHVALSETDWVAWVPAWTLNLVCLPLSLLGGALTRRAVRRPNRVGGAWAATVAACAGWMLAGPTFTETTLRGISEPAGVPTGPARLTADVLRTRVGRDASALVRVVSGRGLHAGTALRPEARFRLFGLDEAVGTRVQILAKLHERTRFENPTPSPQLRPPAPDGIGRVLGAARVVREAPWYRRAAHGLRRILRERFSQTLSRSASATARALLLGESGALEASEKQALRSAGLAHLLAVSGLHILLVAGSALLFARWLWARLPTALAFRGAVLDPSRVDPHRAGAVVGISVALSYALLVGSSPSAWRAAGTAAFVWGGRALGRRVDPWNAASLTVLILGITSPSTLREPALWLSVVATAALLPREPAPPHGSASGLAPVKAILSGTARAWVATAPILVVCFGDISFGGWLANLIALPLASVWLLPGVFAHGALCLVSIPMASAWTAPVVETAVGAVHGLCHLLSSIPLIDLSVPPLTRLQASACALASFSILFVRRRRWRVGLLVACVFTVVAAELWLRAEAQPNGRLRLTFVDVGQGDATLIDLPDGRLMAVDAGGAPGGGPDPGQRVLVPLLRARRRQRIDVLVVTHPDPDHYGGVGALLERFDIGEVWTTQQGRVEHPEGEWSRMLHKARAQGARIVYPGALCTAPRRFGAARVDVVWPCPRYDPGYGANDNSLVLMLTIGAHRFALTGDIEAYAEAALSEPGRLGAPAPSLAGPPRASTFTPTSPAAPTTVLKVPHHGSRTSSSPELLHAMSPQIAVISAGRNNRFGHPHPEVWARITRAVPRVYRTDVHGGVVVESDGKALRVHPTRPGGLRALDPASLDGELRAERRHRRTGHKVAATR